MQVKINKKGFEALLKLVKEMQKDDRREKIIGSEVKGQYKLSFRYCTVHVDGFAEEELDFPSLDPSVKNDDVISLVFDVVGLDEKFITQIDVVRESEGYEIYLVPDRSEDEVNKFLSEISNVKSNGFS